MTGQLVWGCYALCVFVDKWTPNWTESYFTCSRRTPTLAIRLLEPHGMAKPLTKRTLEAILSNLCNRFSIVLCFIKTSIYRASTPFSQFALADKLETLNSSLTTLAHLRPFSEVVKELPAHMTFFANIGFSTETRCNAGLQSAPAVHDGFPFFLWQPSSFITNVFSVPLQKHMSALEINTLDLPLSGSSFCFCWLFDNTSDVFSHYMPIKRRGCLFGWCKSKIKSLL